MTSTPTSRPTKPYDVARLSSDRISSLLALGLSVPRRQPESTSAHAQHDPKQRQLQVLLLDLNAPILSPAAGVVAFERLTGISSTDALELTGKSYLEALTSEATSRVALEHLFTLGTLLAEERFPPATRLTGAVVRALSTATLFVRFAVTKEAFDPGQCRAVLETLLAIDSIPGWARASIAKLADELR